MVSNYPLTQRAILAGSILGIFAALLSNTALVGYAIFVLCVTVGMTWRRHEAPVFPFIVAFQWMQITSGYLFWVATGEIPTVYAAGDINRTVTIALTGLLLLAGGIRVAAAVLPHQDAREERMYVGNLKGLFWLVMGLYGVNYVSILNTKTFGAFDAILGQVLLVRQIPLLLLWLEIIRRQEKKAYLWISLAWILIPSFGSYFSDFKTPLLLALIVSAAVWKPWENQWWRFSIGGTTRTVAIAMAVVFLALTWQAGVKRDTRRAYDAEAVGTGRMERVRLFVTSAANSVPIVLNDTQNVVEDLISRVWYVVFFSRVLEYVPAVEPHANGELLQMAVSNAILPRFVFRDKRELPSDSYYTRRFAGVAVGDQGTSISIGYMAEFYADWGLNGMFASVFVYGLLLGGAAWLLRRLIEPSILINPSLVTALLIASFFEAQFIKTLAALMIATGVTIGLTWMFRRRLENLLQLRSVEELQPSWRFGNRPSLQPRRRRAVLTARNSTL